MSSHKKRPNRKPANQSPRDLPFTVPPGVEEQIEVRRTDIAEAMSLIFGLHSILKSHEDPGPAESSLLVDAITCVELSDITELVLLKLHAVHLALDSVTLRAAARDAEAGCGPP